MGRLNARFGWAMAAVVTVASATSARADGPTTAPTAAPAAAVDNPQYGLWTRFKPGTSATMAGDMATPMGKVHLEVTQTLVSVTPDAVKLSQTNQVTVMGKQQPGGPPATQLVPAKQAKDEMRQTGTADVQAMGKTFPCKVFDIAKPASGAGQGTAYVCPDVPGGIVKLVITGPNGKSLTFLLAAADVK